MLLQNSFEGGTDEVEITIGNSGGGSGDAFTDFLGGSDSIYYENALAASGSFCARWTGTGFGLWGWSFTGITETWARLYFRLSDPTPASNMRIMNFTDTGDTVAEVQLRTGGVIALRDNGLTLRYQTTTVLQADTWYRIDVHIQHSTTTGHFELDLYEGANIHGTTPDETIGNMTTNWNTGAQCTGCNFGPTAPGQTMTVYYDEFAVSDTGPIGPAEGSLDTPANFSLSKTNGVREITAAWDAVTGADNYELEVEEWNGSSWDPFYSDTNVLTTSVVLDDTDGVDWNTLYRARVRAVSS